MVDLKCTFLCDSMWYLYTITNLINAKCYVGISTNVGRRWIEHKSGHGSKLVWQSIRKYGVENLVFDVICEGAEEDIKLLEVVLIEQLNTQAPEGYNLTEGGEGSTGWKPSDETRKKMSEAHRGSRNSMHGKTHSDEAKKKISEKRKGSKNPTRSKLNKLSCGSNNPRAREVKIEGILYGCIKEAAEAIGMKPGTLRSKLSGYNRKGNWPIGWGYV